MVSQYIQLTWQKPFQMQITPEFRVEIFKRNVLSRYYKKEKTHLWICIEYSAGYLRDDHEGMFCLGTIRKKKHTYEFVLSIRRDTYVMISIWF